LYNEAKPQHPLWAIIVRFIWLFPQKKYTPELTTLEKTFSFCRHYLSLRTFPPKNRATADDYSNESVGWPNPDPWNRIDGEGLLFGGIDLRVKHQKNTPPLIIPPMNHRSDRWLIVFEVFYENEFCLL